MQRRPQPLDEGEGEAGGSAGRSCEGVAQTQGGVGHPPGDRRVSQVAACALAAPPSSYGPGRRRRLAPTGCCARLGIGISWPAPGRSQGDGDRGVAGRAGAGQSWRMRHAWSVKDKTSSLGFVAWRLGWYDLCAARKASRQRLVAGLACRSYAHVMSAWSQL